MAPSALPVQAVVTQLGWGAPHACVLIQATPGHGGQDSDG